MDLPPRHYAMVKVEGRWLFVAGGVPGESAESVWCRGVTWIITVAPSALRSHLSASLQMWDEERFRRFEHTGEEPDPPH